MQSKVQFWIFSGDKTEWGGGDTLKEAFVGVVLLFFSLIWINGKSLQQLALTKENWLWCLRPVSYLLKRTCDGEQSCRPCREVQTVWKVTPRHQQHSQQPYLLGRGSGHSGLCMNMLALLVWTIMGLFQASSRTDMKEVLVWCYCSYSTFTLTVQCLHPHHKGLRIPWWSSG